MQTPPYVPVLPVPISPVDDALAAINRAESEAARVDAALQAMVGLGFTHGLITLRDASLNITRSAATDRPAHAEALLRAMPGAVWRRRLAKLPERGASDVVFLAGSDAWVAREFFASEPHTERGDGRWLPTDLVVAILRGPQQEVLGLVELAAPADGYRPSAETLSAVTTVSRHLAARVSYDALLLLAQRRAERLQRLQEAGSAMTRLLEAPDIMRELARQAMRVTGADGVMVGVADLSLGRLETVVRLTRTGERPGGITPLGPGLVAEAARTGRAVRAGDREADLARDRAGISRPATVSDIAGADAAASSLMAIPMLSGLQLLGVLGVHATPPDVFSAEDQEVLTTMAAQAATAVANAQRYAESERDRRQTEALADVARAVSGSLKLGEVYRLILRHAVALLRVEGACLALRTDEYLHIVAGLGVADVLAGIHLPLDSSLMGRAVLDETLLVSNDMPSDPRVAPGIAQLVQGTRAAAAPLITPTGPIGTITVVNREQPFTTDDARVLQRLADHVAVAIVNARLFEEVERATQSWKIAFDAIATGLAVLDDAGRVTRCNARAAELCGLTIAQLLGRVLPEHLCAAGTTAREQLVQLVQRAQSGGDAVRDVVDDVTTGQRYDIVASPHPSGGCVVVFDHSTMRA